MNVSTLLKSLLFLLALGGVVVSVLAWRVHNSEPGTADVCSINEHWDCGTVQHSRFAVVHVPGSNGVSIPVAGIGVAGYTAFLLLLVFDSKRARLLFFVMAIGGMGFALYLSYIEDRILLVWCLYCVISQGIIALVMILSGLRLYFARNEN